MDGWVDSDRGRRDDRNRGYDRRDDRDTGYNDRGAPTADNRWVQQQRVWSQRLFEPPHNALHVTCVVVCAYM